MRPHEPTADYILRLFVSGNLS